MKRRAFLGAAAGSFVAGCVGSTPETTPNTTQTTTSDSAEPTMQPTSTQARVEPEVTLSFGEWFSSDDLSRAIRIDELNLRDSYVFNGAEYAVPGGNRIAVVEFEQKNIGQNPIRETINRNLALHTTSAWTPVSPSVHVPGRSHSYIFGDVSNAQAPYSLDKLDSGQKRTFVSGALVSESFKPETSPIGFFAHTGDCLALWENKLE